MIACMAACGPGESADGESTSGTTTAGTDSTADSTGGLDASGGATADPCLAFDQADCPEQCMVVPVYEQRPDSCSVFHEGSLCITRGAPLDPDEKTTFYAEIDGQLRYVESGQSCFGDVLPGVPVGWAECSGAPGEPEPCSCVCGSEGCPYDAEVELLDACFEATCGETEYYTPTDPLGAYEQCVITALRDRTPGVVETIIVGYSGERSRVYLDGSEQAQFAYAYGNDTCKGGLLDGTWEPNQVCTLQPPDYFEDCLAADTSEAQACLTGSNWFTGCASMDAACP